MKYTLAQIKTALVTTWETEGDLNFLFTEGKFWVDDWDIFTRNLSIQSSDLSEDKPNCFFDEYYCESWNKD